MKTILGAALIALAITLIGTKFFIGWLHRKHYGQPIRSEGPSTHSSKRGTPTMGGIVIIAACLLAYFGSHLIMWTPPSVTALLVMGLLTATGLVGFADDWIKISKKRSLGLTPHAKLIGQVAIGATFGFLALWIKDDYGMTSGSTSISFLRDIEWLRLPMVVAIIWMTFIITSMSNAVNITDGLDGLATGASGLVFAVYTLINIWQRNQWCELASSAGPRCYEVSNPYDLAVVSVSLAAACFGFLWWNTKPAKVFLGDTGSLALGAAMGGLAICTRTELLAVILGALFVIEILSVVIQVSYFKLSGGKRVFKMAPLHHHFELLGWEESTVVVRFWIVCGIMCAIGFGIFYAEWVLGQ